MATLHLTIGLPGSGKTTRAREMVDAAKKTSRKLIRINRDDLRKMHFNMDGVLPGKLEGLLSSLQQSAIRHALTDGHDVIVDDTNLNPKFRRQLEHLAADCGADVNMIDMTHVPVQECIKRDLKRERSVGADVIWRMYDRYLAPEPYPVDSDLPDCVIVDLDGTLAHMNGRSPYDWHRVGEDTVDRLVVAAIKGLLADNPMLHVIPMSGRDGSCFEDTRIWIRDCLGAAISQNLIMRAAGDQRRDSIVKRELFDQHIRGRYNPVLVLDDRKQVVDECWRAMGITTWQVAPGRF